LRNPGRKYDFRAIMFHAGKNTDAQKRQAFITSIIIPRLHVSLPCTRPVPGGRLPVNRNVADSPDSNRGASYGVP